MTNLVLPIVHLNGTSKEALLEQRVEAGRRLRATLEALANMAPNGRDYYPDPGRFERAVAQHRRRVEILTTLMAELVAEAEAVADL